MIKFKDIILESTSDFKNWKRKNVTLRGIKNLGSDNQVYGSIGNEYFKTDYELEQYFNTL